MSNSAAEKLTHLLECHCDIPSEHSFEVYHLALIWSRLKQQGLDKYMFCMDYIQSFDLFRQCVLDKDIWAYAGFSKVTGEPCAFAILDNLQGGTARLHYTFFRNEESIRNKEIYARVFLDFLFFNRTLDCLLLITPVSFRHSNRLALRLDAQLMGTIPSIIPIYHEETQELEYGESNLYKLVSPFYKKGMRRKIPIGRDVYEITKHEKS